MRREIFFLICSLFICSCHHAGRIVQNQDVSASLGTVPYRAGTIPYRNDGKAVARRNNALRKIAKFCGTDGYTVTHEGTSSASPNMSEVDFQCGVGSTASAYPKVPAHPINVGAADASDTIVNPNLNPRDFDQPQ